MKWKGKPLQIRDELHGDILFDPLMRRVIDHRLFQRLRYIKQLGLAEYVFPSATHSRFQHSLGASYLAGRYFKSLVKAWRDSPLERDLSSPNTHLHIEKTKNCLSQVSHHEASFEFWHRVSSIGGLLHDIGHGPWSHSFEHLELRPDISSWTQDLFGPLKAYFDPLAQEKKKLKHEDIGVLFLFLIFKELDQESSFTEWPLYVLTIAGLIHKSLYSGPLKKSLENEIENRLQDSHVQGGIGIYHLLRPILSGPFDVDRIDYIQRDGRNCGVSIGGIEWRRIVNKLVPCLADHRHPEEPNEVVLISNLKNQHVLDDFVFSLFQMYTQVYMHPKIMGLEDAIKKLIERENWALENHAMTLDFYSSLSDIEFLRFLTNKIGIKTIDALLHRDPGFELQVVSGEGTEESQLKKLGYTHIDTESRAMVKDSTGVLLFMSRDPGKNYGILPWTEVSPVAKHFYTVTYSPKIWIKVGR